MFAAEYILQNIANEQYIQQTCCTTKTTNNEPLCTMKEAHMLKRKLSGFVISPLDKNAGMLHVMCKNYWHRTYDIVFTDEQLYKPIHHSLEVEKEKQHRAFVEKGLDNIAPWNSKGELPESYFLTKDKDLHRRPVVTAWNHPAKQALKICAKGGTMLLKSASNLKHFGITSTNQFGRLYGIQT